MSTLNPSEQKLALWTPRHPSAKLRKRLFDQPLSPGPEPAAHWPRLLAATATSLALFTLMFNPAHPVDPFFDTTAPRWTILAPSNQWLASYLVSDDSPFRNAPPSQRFGWTNITPSPSSTIFPR
jgi:hypothetical protein